MLCTIGIVALGVLSSSVIVAGSPITPGQTPFFSKGHTTNLEPILDDEFGEWMNEIGYKWGMNGVAVGVTRRTKDADGQWTDQWVTESKGYGVADRWGHPVDENTLFGIGSNSKLFTALALGMLVEDEAYSLSWDTKISDIIPGGEWVLQDPSMEKNATLIDILSHRTGLPAHDLSYSRTDTPISLISKLRYLRPSAEFRDINQYNNQMYVTAAYIVEHLTNQTIQEFVTEKFIKPLGMDDSTYVYDETMFGHGLADGFVALESGHPEGKGRDKTIYKPIPYFDLQGDTSLIAGAGGIISNVKDSTRWLQTLLLMGRHPVTNEQIVPEAAIQKAAEGITVIFPFPKDPSLSAYLYGFGQMSYSNQGHFIVEHTGGTVGHYTLISRAPYDGVGIVILTNTLLAGADLMGLVKWRLYEKVLNLKHVDWESKIPVPEEKETSKNLSLELQTPSTLSLHSYSGVFTNLAYGTIIICPFDLENFSPPTPVDPQFQSHCNTTVSELSQAYNYNTTHQKKPDLVFSWDKYWSTHIVISHHDKDTFTARTLILFPPPFPEAENEIDSPEKKDNKPFAIDYSVNGSATFVVDSQAQDSVLDDTGVDEKVVLGFAMKGVWGAGMGAKEVEGTSKETAEVWFDRISHL